LHCIAATIEVEILFAAKQAKRLERKACAPPKIFSCIFRYVHLFCSMKHIKKVEQQIGSDGTYLLFYDEVI
jgi:hypothetical protein